MDAPENSATIVVGGGIAGIVAALELLALGHDVLLVDRDTQERFGGQARESFGGILAVDTPLQRHNGVRDSAALALADWCRFGELGPADGWPYRWAESYVHECRHEVYEWLIGLGVRFLPVPQWPERRGNSVPRWHVVWGTGRFLTLRLIDRLMEQARAPGARLWLRFGHRVERFLFEGGRVAGVAGVLESDGAGFAYAGTAVLVASGGIMGDPALVRRYWPAACGPAPRELLVGAHRYGDGRVHRASQAAGAQLTHLSRMWNYAAGVRHWQPRQPDHGLSLVPPRSALWLDACGRRFAPPLLAGWDTSEQVARIAMAGGYAWQVLNRRIALRELVVAGAEFNPSIRERRLLAFVRELLVGNRWLVDTLTAHCPDVIVAASPAQLVAGMNALLGPEHEPVRLEWVLAALADFEWARRTPGAVPDAQWQNIRLARQWKGDRMRTARPHAMLNPRAGPLMAIRERIISRKSLGGIRTDLAGRVLDESDNPVAGLFAAGEASGFGGGGMNGKRALEGTFLGGCIYSARRAARGMHEESVQGVAPGHGPGSAAVGAR